MTNTNIIIRYYVIIFRDSGYQCAYSGWSLVHTVHLSEAALASWNTFCRTLAAQQRFPGRLLSDPFSTSPGLWTRKKNVAIKMNLDIFQWKAHFRREVMLCLEFQFVVREFPSTVVLTRAVARTEHTEVISFPSFSPCFFYYFSPNVFSLLFSLPSWIF